MKLGVAFPAMEAAGDPDDIRRFILAAEDLGYDYIMHYDHVVKASHEDREPRLNGPYTEKDSFHDPFVFFGFAAAVSRKLEFVTGVLVLPQRQTALVAQQAADVDLLSRERFRMGVGVGWNYVEYQALGQDFHARGKKLDEQLGYLRQLWSEPLVTFEGKFDRIERAGINPRPRRQIPIFIGGHTDVAYRRAALKGDGFIFAGGFTPPVEAMAQMRGHLNAVGRSEEGFGYELLAWNRGPEESADLLRTWRDAGGHYGCVTSLNFGYGRNMDAHIDHIARFKQAMG